MNYFYQKNIVQEAIQEVEYKLATEGWGTFFGSLIPFYNIYQAVTNFNTAEKILQNPKIQAYIDGVCKKQLEIVKKENRDYDFSKHNSAESSWYENQTTTKNTTGILNYAKNDVGWTRVKNWQLMIFYDSDHIERIDLALLGIHKSTRKTRRFFRTVPAPTKEDMQKLGFRHED